MRKNNSTEVKQSIIKALLNEYDIQTAEELVPLILGFAATKLLFGNYKNNYSKN